MHTCQQNACTNLIVLHSRSGPKQGIDVHAEFIAVTLLRATSNNDSNALQPLKPALLLASQKRVSSEQKSPNNHVIAQWIPMRHVGPERTLRLHSNFWILQVANIETVGLERCGGTEAGPAWETQDGACMPL